MTPRGGAAVVNRIIASANGVEIDTDVVGWRAWYSTDGITVQRFDSATSTPQSLPITGCQVVMLYYGRDHDVGKPYRRIIQGSDFYFVYRDANFTPALTVFDQSDADPTAVIAADPNKTLLGLYHGTLLLNDAFYQSIVDEAMAAEAAP